MAVSQKSHDNIGQQVQHQDDTHPGELAVQTPHVHSVRRREGQQHAVRHDKSKHEQQRAYRMFRPLTLVKTLSRRERGWNYSTLSRFISPEILGFRMMEDQR